MKPEIKAVKDCKFCGGRAYTQLLAGGVAVCRCITDQIVVMNSDGQEGHLKLSKDGHTWDLTFGVDISKDDFEAYEEVRASGATNMFDVRTVGMLSGLDRPTITAIMKQYDALCVQYPGVRKDD